MRILGYILLVYWAFALINTILNLLLLRHRTATLGREPFVSIIVPARDEERSIELSVRAFLAQTYSAFEVIVVNDRSSDSTGRILDGIAAQDARLIVVHGEEPPPGWLGKPWALHQGSLRAKGELLLFVDADVRYAPGTLSAGVEHLQSSGAAMAFLFTHFETRGFWENVMMPTVPFTPFLAPLWLGERFPVAILAIGGGTGNLIRRVEYDAVNGHEALCDAVIDDVGLAHHVRRKGHKTTIARTERFVSVRMYHGLGEIVRGFTKNIFPVFGRSYVLAAGFGIGTLIFHLFPFVLALMGDRLAIVVVAMILVTRLIFFRALRYPLWSALLTHPLMVIIWVWILLRSVWFVGIRRNLTWRGRVYDPAQTRFGAER